MDFFPLSISYFTVVAANLKAFAPLATTHFSLATAVNEILYL